MRSLTPSPQPIAPASALSRPDAGEDAGLPLLIGGGLAILAALAWLYLPIFGWLMQGWKGDEYYAHGSFLPFISAFLLWQKRARLTQLWRERPSQGTMPSGLIALALVMQLVGTLVDMNIVRALQAFSIPIVLLGIARTLAGKKFEREMRFPLLFLWLAVPLSGPMVETLTVPLQNYAASWSAMLLGLLGMQIDRVGVNLYTPLYHFVVAVPCSGLKTAITLFTMGILIAHILPDLTQAQRVFLCILSVPLALFANTLRVMAIVTIGNQFGTEAAEGFLHSWSGLFMFVIALGSLLCVGTYLGRAKPVKPAVKARNRKTRQGAVAPSKP